MAKAITFKVTSIRGSWVEGKFGTVRFSAKIFSNPSVFGINDGRVSKLGTSNGVHYERGWESGEDEPEKWEALVKHLETFAQSKKFLESF